MGHSGNGRLSGWNGRGVVLYQFSKDAGLLELLDTAIHWEGAGSSRERVERSDQSRKKASQKAGAGRAAATGQLPNRVPEQQLLVLGRAEARGVGGMRAPAAGGRENPKAARTVSRVQARSVAGTAIGEAAQELMYLEVRNPPLLI